MKRFAILGIVLLSCPELFADHCANTVCATPVAVPVVATVLPLYGASYVGGGNYGDDETKELLRQLLAEMKAMREQLASQQPLAPPPDGPLRAPKIDVQATMRTSCVGCHNPTKNAGDLSLVTADGKLRPLSGPERKSIINRLDGKGGDRMPPADKPQLAPEVKRAIQAALTDTVPTIPPAKK